MAFRTGWKGFLLGCGLAAALLGLPGAASAQSKAPPKAALTLTTRDSRVTPHSCGYSSTGGGSVVVTQPAPDTIVVSMTGTAGAGACTCGESRAALDFLLDQQFEVEFAPGGPQSGQLILEGHVIGLLRVEGKKHGGTAGMTRAMASVGCAGSAAVSIDFDAVTAACGEGVAVNSKRGPVSLPVIPGCYHLHQEFSLFAAQPACLLPRKASADFAPPPTLEAKWISHPDPFREAVRTGNGFHITIRVVPDPPVPPAVLPPAPRDPLP